MNLDSVNKTPGATYGFEFEYEDDEKGWTGGIIWEWWNKVYSQSYENQLKAMYEVDEVLKGGGKWNAWGKWYVVWDKWYAAYMY